LNFALYASSAQHVTLVIDAVLEDGTRQRNEIALDPEVNRTGEIWHCALESDNPDLRYGYRVGGVDNQAKGIRFYPDRILLDPYCKQFVPREWGGDSAYGESPLCLTRPDPPFDWQGDRPLNRPLADTIIYELHVRGFSRHPSSGVSHPGTYQGLIEKIPYLKDLGITAVELLPLNEWDETDNRFYHPDSGERLLNYWGYNPLSFFALRSGLAGTPGDHINEFKSLVRSLHQAGIEVILDMVFNHSGETNYEGTTSVFRGISNASYYLISPDDGDYLNFSGCGNTINCNHPVVQEMILDALRYLVSEMHVDGFRFDLAAIFSRGQDGTVLVDPPLIERIASDPVLKSTKIIAEAWDASGLYQLGSFSTDPRWQEWNGRFRDDLRRFMAGHPDTVRDLATRIAGSSDIYSRDRKSPLNSVNFITCHDGFTLYDLVSYDQKHNRANGEGGRDGESHNLSWNSGHEGDPCPDEVAEMRWVRMRTFAALLLFSQGVPMLTAGDEFGRTQQGNNNCWCQDNELSWLDWSLAEKHEDLFRFIKACISLRRKYPVFRRTTFFAPPTGDGSIPDSDISWQSLYPGEQDWSADCRTIGFLLYGSHTPERPEADFFIMVNGYLSDWASFTLPDPPENRHWRLIVDTAVPSPDDIVPVEIASGIAGGSQLAVAPMGLVVLQSSSNAQGD
jgi:glycogen operon protein